MGQGIDEGAPERRASVLSVADLLSASKRGGQGDGAPNEQWLFEIRAFLNRGMWKRHGLRYIGHFQERKSY